jgi:predicted nucleotidyltransferase
MSEIFDKNLRESIKATAARYGAQNVRVFGSFARGDANNQSDIDLLVEMESGRSLFDLMSLQDALGQTLGRPVDVVTEKSLNKHLKQTILNEAVAL